MPSAHGLYRLIELKPASSVLELIRIRNLPRELGEQLDPSVREKFRELWAAAQYRGDE